MFKQFNIQLDVGRPTNPNKNPIAENTVDKCEKEILRYKLAGKTLTEKPDGHLEDHE